MEPRHAFCNARGCGQNSASELDSGGCYASFYAGSWPAMQQTPVFPGYFVMQVVMQVSMQAVCCMHA